MENKTIDQLYRLKYNKKAAEYAARKRAGLVTPKHNTEPKCTFSTYTTQATIDELDRFVIKAGYDNRSNAITAILQKHFKEYNENN